VEHHGKPRGRHGIPHWAVRRGRRLRFDHRPDLYDRYRIVWLFRCKDERVPLAEYDDAGGLSPDLRVDHDNRLFVVWVPTNITNGTSARNPVQQVAR